MNKGNKIVLGIDPGFADTGFGVLEVDGSKIKCLEFGSIKTAPKDIFVDRLKKIDKALQEIVNKYKPSLVSVEKIFFNNNAKTALMVGHARGVILLNISKNNIPIVEFTPLQLKQSICNYGRADKNQIKKMIKIFLNLKELPKSDDAADALGLAICALNFLKK
ncbi:crossover junction endodeoxyribonuclease RuvC [Candidatus Falkowbacteria bacterium HGW-Falkowbacteria-1]|jgi:crossover junction endodeoxyribonuclease RuvC|uniref:Crossover junction endodeoxyribonuclease RuvC n=1 Tax=Candidatus Falkowbacteria bacterium HGW-Falkowbacteria-1 TaxID=2013768 RepID=A0A2N2EAI1_9BACT|nr:MAG: crossover junction endodeoxyribonuclease RuvC [Candidatus Falkowbacteria bacterium HGW-Falkowbacteria-1]